MQLVSTSLYDPTGSLETGYAMTGHVQNYLDASRRLPRALPPVALYAAIATVACMLLGYPLAYAIAFKAGRWKNLMLVAVIAPFFTSFLVRTLSWKLHPGRPRRGSSSALRALHLLGPDGRLLATPFAVVTGLTYNFLPFMVLPLYARLEKIDPRLIEAGEDLYASPFTTFRKVTLPLSMPGVVAGTLLTFIPAAGDYINAELLGNPRTQMIGNVIQNLFDGRLLPRGGGAVGDADGRHRGAGAGLRPPRRHRGAAVTRRREVARRPPDPGLGLLVLLYMFLPIFVVVLMSFNDPAVAHQLRLRRRSRWTTGATRASPTACASSVVLSAPDRLLATLRARRCSARLVAFALVRHRFRGRAAANVLIFLPMASPEIVMGSSLLALFVTAGFAGALGFWTILVAHIMFCLSFVVVTVKARLAGLDPRLEQAAMDLYANEWQTFWRVTFPLVFPGILAAALLSFSLSFDDFIITNLNAGQEVTFPMYVWGAAQRGIPPQINVVGTVMFLLALALVLAGELRARSVVRTRGH